MVNLNNKNIHELYFLLLSDEKIPLELEPYKELLKLICLNNQYSPDLRDIIYSLGFAKKDYNIIGSYIQREDLSNQMYGSGWKDYNYFKSLYDSRIERFNIYNNYLLNIIKFNKNKNKFYYISDVIQGLSTDYTKIEENNIWTRYINGKYAISSILDEIINNIVKNNYLDLNGLYEINPVLANLFKDICMDIISLIDLNMSYVELCTTLLFIRNIIGYEILKSIDILQDNLSNTIQYLINYYKVFLELPSFINIINKICINSKITKDNESVCLEIKKILEKEKLNEIIIKM